MKYKARIIFILIIILCITSKTYVSAAIMKQAVDSDGTVTYYVSNKEDRFLAFHSMFARMEVRSKIIYTNKYIGDPNNFYDYINYRYSFQDNVIGAFNGIGNFSGTGFYNDNNTFIYEFYYYETPEQSNYVYHQIRDAIKNNISNLKSDYQKAYFAYNWVLDNTKTDYSMSNYSAYSGIAGEGTVCQGYSTLYAAIAKELGLDCQIIFGGVNGSSTNHAWNAIKLDGKWYCIDSTWGDTESRDKYFLVTKDVLSSREYGYHISDMYEEYNKAGEIFATENYNTAAASSSNYVMPSVYNIIMDVFKYNKLDIGEGYSFMVSNPDHIPISFKSDNPNIARVNADGIITGVSKGTTTISGYNDTMQFSQSCVITVSDKKNDTKLSKDTIKLKKADSFKLKVSNALNHSKFTWSSSNVSVAKVSKSGTVTGVSTGSCVITCTVTNGTSNVVLKCKVTIK
ncbi:Ig-like domain-containing protein [Anaerocolumna sp. AGMB13025]|uniref:Ig-like domain-containing protein n=1 Tax=Anaerocolumna sp. AGMB13025 TaxID=3039116 RepID=UPI00241D3CFC|nr:Ig-like domain-containing protein [Anaerocolumna sp. AGMB13025]WFR59955.1 Ig-like domain-containing protein [Anaerocolumna sp. AGMB13025]